MSDGREVERQPATRQPPVLVRRVKPEGLPPVLRPVDICFVVDTTGSMDDKIKGLIRCMVDLVRQLSTLSLDWRLTTVPFGDLTVGDRVVGDQPFVNAREAAERQLRKMPRFSGGDNHGESVIEAMRAALRKPYRPATVKLIVLLTDEPALRHEGNPNQIVDDLRRAEAICFVASPDIGYYRRWANENGGAWYEIDRSFDTRALLRFLQTLVEQMATVAHNVHELGSGSVRKYLELGAGAGAGAGSPGETLRRSGR